ncbi:uncharacterized protein [Ptychodera flava]|uniref:uncharacterized protein n=1 Tax=Ptychodera flava TaxID=63121 RepID=UPI00396A789A
MASSDVKPSTSDGKGGVSAERSDHNGGRRSTTATKTERNMTKKALIVCDRWGPSIHGGVFESMHLVIRLLQKMGISVHCTAIKATREDVEEARKLGVKLELPTTPGSLKFRQPNSDWLLYHSKHFPNLRKLTNVKFVFGFSMLTSEAAFEITKGVFPRASFYLINLFDTDIVTPIIVDCSEEELEFRKTALSEELKEARCSFSVSNNVYINYMRRYPDNKQYRLSPMINEKYSRLKTYDELFESETFQILSVFHEYEFEDPEKLEVVINAVNEVAYMRHEMKTTPPVWRVVGVPPKKKKKIVDMLQRNSRLKITPKLVTSARELDEELRCSHLVLIQPSSTSYVSLTLAAMCAAIPVIFPQHSHSHEIVKKHFDSHHVENLAVDMGDGPKALKQQLLYVMQKNADALKIAKKIRDYMGESVVSSLNDSNKDFIEALKHDMEAAIPSENISGSEDEATPTNIKDKSSRTQMESENRSARHTAQSSIEDEPLQGTMDINDHEADETVAVNPTFHVLDEDLAVLSDRESLRERKEHQRDADVMEAESTKSRKGGITKYVHRQDQVSYDDDQTSESKPQESSHNISKPERKQRPSIISRLWFWKRKRSRNQREIEITVKPDGIIPQEGKDVCEVDDAFYASKLTKENAKIVGDKLDQRHKDMSLQAIGNRSISYTMDCQSLAALESLMDDYTNENLQKMMMDTFVSDQLLEEIGAIYLSLGVSIDYEEYLLCQEELEDMEVAGLPDEDQREVTAVTDNKTTETSILHQLSNEELAELNDKVECEVQERQISSSVGKRMEREKLRNRDILRQIAEDEKRNSDTELHELMSKWVQVKNGIENMKNINAAQSGLPIKRWELIKHAGAIINEVDIPLERKQELLSVFQKFLPVGPEKTDPDPDNMLLIEGSVLMGYVENTVHDADIATERKQEVIQRFRDFIEEISEKVNVQDRLTAKLENLQARISEIVGDAHIPDELKEVYVQWRRVKKGKPLPDTIRSLSRRGEKPGEVLRPRGLTINQNGHVVVSDIGDEDSDQPGSVKTVTADTAQILTSVTVHGLPHRFRPWHTKMADNGDYYTADDGNKCIVVSDAKSKVKQIIAMGKLKDPTGVFVDKDRNVFIADYSANCVIKCNGDGDIISSQQLSRPWSLTMNSKYQLIVSCRGDENCIYVLDSNLEILNQFGSDHLEEPYGVTVDNADNIYVADYFEKIVKFDRQGEYQETVTVDVNPYDIAVFTDGRIVFRR